MMCEHQEWVWLLRRTIPKHNINSQRQKRWPQLHHLVPLHTSSKAVTQIFNDFLNPRLQSRDGAFGEEGVQWRTADFVKGVRFRAECLPVSVRVSLTCILQGLASYVWVYMGV